MPTNPIVTEGNKQPGLQQTNKFLYPSNPNDRNNTVAGKLDTNILVTDQNGKKGNQSFNQSM
jgi:hypothetical protein